MDTPFFDIAEAGGSTLALKKYALVSPERVAALALKDSLRRRPVSVCSLPIKSLFLLTKLVPHSVILDVMDWMKRKGY